MSADRFSFCRFSAMSVAFRSFVSRTTCPVSQISLRPAARSLRLFGDEANDMTLMAGSPLGLVVGIFVEEDP